MSRASSVAGRPWRGPALAAALLGGLAACSTGSPPRDAFYRLDIPEPARLAAPVLPGVVEVSRFGAEGLTGDRAMLYSYRDRPEQLLRYDYRYWTEPPPILLQDGLVRLLRDVGAADQVVTADLRVPPDYVVEGRLRRFEQVAGTPPGVVVVIDMGVVRTHGNQLILLDSYRSEKTAASEQTSDVVTAYQAALGEVFGRLVADLSRLPKTP
jgi:ABC-type uncharacterized transport system auxiliary subunit